MVEHIRPTKNKSDRPSKSTRQHAVPANTLLPPIQLDNNLDTSADAENRMTPDIQEEFTIPPRPARHAPYPAWLNASPALPATQGQNLYLHQAHALDLYHQGHNVVISTGTASGKSLIFQIPTLHQLATRTRDTAIAIYPIKALARDQLESWRQIAPQCGISPDAINQIDGDTPYEDRANILEQSRVAIMTPDIIQAWLLNFSDFAKTSNKQVNHIKKVITDFLEKLAILILDEAHTYDSVIGTNCMYLFHRLQYRCHQIQRYHPPIRIIAASATIANPDEHMTTLTGQPFRVIDEDMNGAPKAPLTVQHINSRDPHQGGVEDLAALVQDIIHTNDTDTYLAFIDDRQLVEKCAGAIEAAHGWTEAEIIAGSKNSMSYRAGLMYREHIENALRTRTIRGVTSTSALEMGIDMPDINIGINLGMPNSIQQAKQRAGRIGRQNPGRFIIMADRYAFQYHDSMRDFWDQPMEPARIYLDNPTLRVNHARCIVKENGLHRTPTKIPHPVFPWPDGFTESVQQAAAGNTPVEISPNDLPEYPHRHNIRETAEASVSIVRIDRDGNQQELTRDVTRREALKEAYPLATYRHAKRCYTVNQWLEPQDPSDQTVVQVSAGTEHDTRPIRESSVSLAISQRPEPGTGRLYYTGPSQTTVTDRITGCESRPHPQARWDSLLYTDANIPDVVTRIHTTATTLVIDQDWFDEPDTRKDVAQALIQAMGNLESLHEQDLRATWENIELATPDQILPCNRAIVIWDRVGGGLGIAGNLANNITRYTGKLNQIALDPTERDDNTKPLNPNTAHLLHQWATDITRRQITPELPNQTADYAGITFYNQLESRWAQYFDQRHISWEYRRSNNNGWQPSFVVTYNNETHYAEVREVSDFPNDIANAINRDYPLGHALILGNGPQSSWIRRNLTWHPMRWPAKSR